MRMYTALKYTNSVQIFLVFTWYFNRSNSEVEYLKVRVLLFCHF